MKEIITKNIIEREKGYRYYIDNYGNLCRKREYPFLNVWTIITILIIIASASYYIEINEARKFINNPCVNSCLVKQYVEEFKSLNPGLTIECNYELGSCEYRGIIDERIKEQLKNFDIINMTYIENG